MLAVTDQISDDAFQQVEQRLLVGRRLRERGASPFGLPDDRESQGMERLHVHVPACLPAEAFLDALRQFVPGVALEREEQQFLRAAVAAFDHPAGFGHHDGCLAAAGGRHDQITVVVHGDGPALLVRQGPRFNAIQKPPGAVQFAFQEGPVRPRPHRLRVHEKRAAAPDRLDEWFRGERFRRPRRQQRCRPLHVLHQRREGAVANVGLRRREFSQPGVGRAQRRRVRCQGLLPPRDSRVLQPGC